MKKNGKQISWLSAAVAPALSLAALLKPSGSGAADSNSASGAE